MDNDANYYRGFVDLTGLARDAYYTPDPIVGSGYNERQPIQGTFPGYQWLNGSVRAVDLFPNSKKRFEYMTQWELIHSSLAPHFPSFVKFRPVVDAKPLINPDPVFPGKIDREYYPLVAHYGTAPAEKIFVPGEYAGSHGWTLDRLSELVAKDVPAFVNNIDPGNGWGPFERGGVFSHTVLTDIEGRILKVYSSRARDDSIEEADPMVFFMAGQLVADLGAAIGHRVVVALARRAARKEAQAVINSLAKEMAQWGELQAFRELAMGMTTAELQAVKSTMERVMPNLVDASSKLKAMSIRELDTALRKTGFSLFQAQEYGPDGGYQLFYQNGRVVARVKTMGEKFKDSPRFETPHASFSLTDGSAMRWENDIAKFTREGGIAPKNIVSLDDWDAKAMAQSQNVGMRNHWYVVKDGHTKTLGDAWANSTHFNAPKGFGLEGADDLARPFLPPAKN